MSYAKTVSPSLCFEKVAKIMASPVRCVNVVEKVGVVVDLLQNTKHNGFPCIKPVELKDGTKIRAFVGIIRRDQLLVLLTKKAFDLPVGKHKDFADPDRKKKIQGAWKAAARNAMLKAKGPGKKSILEVLKEKRAADAGQEYKEGEKIDLNFGKKKTEHDHVLEEFYKKYPDEITGSRTVEDAKLALEKAGGVLGKALGLLKNIDVLRDDGADGNASEALARQTSAKPARAPSSGHGVSGNAHGSLQRQPSVNSLGSTESARTKVRRFFRLGCTDRCARLG